MVGDNIHCPQMLAATQYFNQNAKRCELRFIEAQSSLDIDVVSCRNCGTYLRHWLGTTTGRWL